MLGFSTMSSEGASDVEIVREGDPELNGLGDTKDLTVNQRRESISSDDVHKAEFWGQFMPDIPQEQIKDQEEIDSRFDLTERRIGQIYAKFFVGSDQEEALQQALQFQDIRLPRPIIKRLLSLAKDRSVFGYEDFKFVFTRLKMAQLLEMSRKLQAGQSMKVSSVEYPDFAGNSPDTHRDEFPLEKWIFQPDTHREHNKMRWVHAEGLTLPTLLMLASKYQLHPVAVEDAIEMHKQPAKIDRYGDHIFCSLNVLQLHTDPAETADRNTPPLKPSFQVPAFFKPDPSYASSASVRSASEGALDRKNKIERGDAPVRIYPSYLSIFIPPGAHTLLSIRVMHNDPDIDNRFTDAGASRLNREFRVPSFSHISAERAPHHAEAARDDDLFGLRTELKRPSTKLIDHKSDYLLYSILDRSVDELSPIVAAYSYRLKHFQRELKSRGSRFPRQHLDEISAITMELKDIQRTVRPLTGILKFMLEDHEIGVDFAPYLEDLHDHVEQRIDDFKELVERCGHLSAQHTALSDRRMNDTLYVLTIVTTVFVPAQFVTGMYGMNFEGAGGGPGIPELTMQHGYLYFWLLVIGLSLLCALMFRFCL